ncbi:MAG: distal tail protein Dit [Aerococcus sanguinicola]
MRTFLRVDGEPLDDLIIIRRVHRDAGPLVKNRIITVEATIKRDVLATVDVLNRILHGREQRFYFSDQPDRYWEGFVREKIELSSAWFNADFSFRIEVPSGVSLSRNRQKFYFPSAQLIALRNNGTNEVYPQFEFEVKQDTEMIAVSSPEGSFQFGNTPVAWEPLPEPTYKRKSLKLWGHTFDSRKEGIRNWSSYSIENVSSHWKNRGSISLREAGWHMQEPVNGQVTIAPWATHWQTGERMANWIKWETCQVVDSKPVRQSNSRRAYKLRFNGVIQGWLLEQDIVGSQNFADGGTIPSYGSGSGSFGPAISKSFNSHQSTDWRMDAMCFFKSYPWQKGRLYVAVMSGNTIIASICLEDVTTTGGVRIAVSVPSAGFYNTTNKGAGYQDFDGRLQIEKQGNKFTFRTQNRVNKQNHEENHILSGANDMIVDRVMVWHGRDSSAVPPTLNSVAYIGFWGKNAYIQDNAPINVPSPVIIAEAGDIVRINMDERKAYVNGRKSLNMIQHGSERVMLRPGTTELAITTDATRKPDVTVSYTEVYR